MHQEAKQCGSLDCISKEHSSPPIEEGVAMLWRHQDGVTTTDKFLGIKGTTGFCWVS